MSSDVQQKTCLYADCVGMAEPDGQFCAVHRSYEKCRECKGSGVCPTCKGGDLMECCAGCNFTGRCIKCRGGIKKRAYMQL
jgi:hypothetical protein